MGETTVSFFTCLVSWYHYYYFARMLTARWKYTVQNSFPVGTQTFFFEMRLSHLGNLLSHGLVITSNKCNTYCFISKWKQ